MLSGFNPTDWQKSLQIAGSDYQLPETSSLYEQQESAPAPQAAASVPTPPRVEISPEPEGKAEQPTLQQAASAAGQAAEYPGLKNSPVAGLVRKVAGAVAAFYTGGTSAALMNVGAQALSDKNPNAGAAANSASKFF